MSGLVGAINTALTGLNAFEAGITTVSENLANATTAGYAVEGVNILTAEDVPGEAGSGVQSPQITRAADGFAAGVLRTANSAGSAASVQAISLTDISNALQNNGNIQTSINQFFEDVSNLASDPTSTGAQQTVLSDAQVITGSFQSAAGSLNSTLSGANSALQQDVSTANNLLGQLGKINQALVVSPNDPSLLDQQEAALNSLSQLLPVSVLPQDNGSVLISTNGSFLLNQAGAQTLSLTPGSGTTPPQINVTGSSVPLTLSETDGSIGANVQGYQAGAQALQALNALAATFSANVNTVQAEGLTPTGAEGGNLFSVPSPSVTPASNNTGGATLSAQITNASQLPTDGGPFTLTYSSATGNYTQTDQATGASVQVTPVTAGTPPATTLAFAGITVTVSGTPNNGDSFVVDPAPDAASGISVVATNPNQIAAADPFVATPGVLTGGNVVDNNAGTTTIGTDTVVGTAAATTAGAAGAAVVPGSFFTSPNNFGSTSLQIVFTSSTGSTTPDGFIVETPGNPPTPVLDAAGNPITGTFSTTSGGTLEIGYPSTTSTGQANAAAAQFWQLPISGTPATGDTVTLQPGGSSSGSNANRMSQLLTAPGTTSSGTLQQAVVGLQTSLGANAQQAQQLASAATSQVTSATTNVQNIAGVNTDQQAVLLINYQQAYQAAAQVISTAHSMFESLVQSV
jgi:flagellar hook-associated protein 1